MRFTAEISCFESTFDIDIDDADDASNGEDLQARHFESDEAEATVSIRSRRSSTSVPRSRRVSSKKSMSRISEEVCISKVLRMMQIILN